MRVNYGYAIKYKYLTYSKSRNRIEIKRAANSWFSHIAVECVGEKTSNEWLEAVTDEQYGKLN